jgi:hypothetical protein
VDADDGYDGSTVVKRRSSHKKRAESRDPVSSSAGDIDGSSAAQTVSQSDVSQTSTSEVSHVAATPTEAPAQEVESAAAPVISVAVVVTPPTAESESIAQSEAAACRDLTMPTGSIIDASATGGIVMDAACFRARSRRSVGT